MKRAVINNFRIFYGFSPAFSPAFSPSFSTAFSPAFLPQFLPHFSRIATAFLPQFPPHFWTFFNSELECVSFEMKVVFGLLKETWKSVAMWNNELRGLKKWKIIFKALKTGSSTYFSFKELYDLQIFFVVLAKLNIGLTVPLNPEFFHQGARFLVILWADSGGLV